MSHEHTTPGHEPATPTAAASEEAAGPARAPRRSAWRRARSWGSLTSLPRGAAIVPIAVLSAAWTASLTGIGISDAAVTGLTLPPVAAPPTVPGHAIEAPASVSAGPVTPAAGSPTRSVGSLTGITPAADTDAGQIPSVALAAYQRAQSVIDAADPTCNLSWQLLAAIGDVESDHGRFHGSVLAPDGTVHPAIYGPRLSLPDTDGGLIDHATGYDRAVGPMQFIPSTWQAVAVDADNDGKRNPQDINDAALGAAVYLCSGPGNLATTTAQKAAVFRYNHSTAYVSLVLAIMRAYMNGDYLASPDSTAATGYLTPTVGADLTPTRHHRHHAHDTATPASPATSDTSDSASTGTTDNAGTGKDHSHDGTGTKKGSGTGGKHPKDPGKPDLPGIPGVKTPQLPHAPHTGVKPVDKLLTTVQAALQCTLDGYVDNPLVSNDKFDVCVTDYTTTGKGPHGEKPSQQALAAH